MGTGSHGDMGENVKVTDLAGLVFAGGAARHPRRAAVQVFEDHFLSLDDQLTDAACVEGEAAY